MDVTNNAGNLRIPRYPNCYGSVSPYLTQHARNRSPIDPRRTPSYNNYGYNSEMREMENAYVMPRVRVENPEVKIYLFAHLIFHKITCHF